MTGVLATTHSIILGCSKQEGFAVVVVEQADMIYLLEVAIVSLRRRIESKGSCDGASGPPPHTRDIVTVIVTGASKVP